MIDYDEVFPLLVGACPSFEISTHALQADANAGEFLRVGHVVLHLIELLTRGETDSFLAVFGIVERVLAEGSAVARMLIADGFLDDLTNTDLYDTTERIPSDFVSWLGPCARQEPVIRPLL
jgi:hypothetical protein